MKKISIIVIILVIVGLVVFFVLPQKTKTTLQSDLTITNVKSVNVSDYEVTVQNKGQGDATKFFYVCMWSESYAAKGKSTTCNSGKIANINENTGNPIPLEAGASQTVTFEGILGLGIHEKLFFIVDKSNDPATNNSISESDEANNAYTLTR